MTLLNQGSSLGQILGKLEAHHDDRQAASTKYADGDISTGLEARFHGNETEVVELGQKVIGSLQADRIVRGKLLEFVNEVLDLADELCVFVVLVGVAQVVASGYLDLA